jgi:hypothetical protein
MADSTSICNSALAKLGSGMIMSLTDDSKQAQFCSRFYDETRDEVLSSHRWNFAMRRATLSRLADAPEFEWAFAYQLPTDCLRVVQLNGAEPSEREGEFAVERNMLMTDADVAQVRYIARITDGSLYPPLFVEALATKLASKLAGPITGSRQLPAELLREYEVITGPKARMADVFEEQRRRKQPWVFSDLVRARYARGM